MILQRIYIGIMLLGLSLSAQAQYYSYKQHINHANDAYDIGNYIEAMIHYDKAMEINNDVNTDVIYNYAEAAYNTNSYTLADSLYRMYLEDESAINPHVPRYKIAEMKMAQGNYEEAITDFDLYLSEYGDVDSMMTKKIDFLRASSDWAINQTIEETYYPATSKSDVNSPYSEHAPYILDDSLYYNSLKFPIEDDPLDRFTSKILNQTKVLKIPGLPQNSIVSHPSFTPDGKHIFFTVGEYTDLNTIRCDIYYAAIDDSGQVGNLVKLPEYINRPMYTSTHPTVSYKGDSTLHLLYVTDRVGGQGGMDIWSADIRDNFEFNEPKNLLGINTDADELSPFHHEESNTLYFSTNGRMGFGGQDVYRVNYEGFVNGDILNLGSNINSPTNDLYFFLTENEKQSYFSSNRKGSQYIDSQFESCCYDIYTADAKLCTVDLELLAYKEGTNELINGASVVIMDKLTGDTVYKGKTSEDHLIEVPCNDNLSVTISKPGYQELTYDLGPLNGIAGQDNKYTSESFLKPLEYALIVSVINGTTSEAINGASVYVTNRTTNEVTEIENSPGNIFTFSIDPDTDYFVEINKDGFKESSFEFRSDINQTTIERVVELRLLDKVEKALLSLGNAIPVSMYFDNDQPDPGTLKETSTKNYTQAYNAYYARKDKFKSVYVSRSKNKEKASKEIEYLFENDLKIGFEKYEIFKRQLLLVLENDQEANIYLRGFASPVAESDYNAALGRRRIDSVRKEFYEWRGGVLVPYIKSKQLVVTERSFGESTSPNDVSDNANAPALSIYSPAASRERRVEIDEIQFNQNQ